MKNDFFDYTLTRGEFAKRIGKSKEAVRSAMRRGKYGDYYRFDGDKYLFKAPDRPRVYYDDNHGQKTIPKKQINRGNHYKANYPNEAFRLHNQRKILDKLNKTDPEFVKKVPELEKIHQQQKAERISTNLENVKIKNYGGMSYGGGAPENSQVIVRSTREETPKLNSYFLCGGTGNSFTGYGESEDRADPGSVEITEEQINRATPIEERTSFNNKIEESIYRAKKHLLKTKGSWD
jgi:hypothetical protein